MVKAATLEVEIGAKIDKFERSLGKVRKDLGGMEKKLSGVSRGASKATTAFSGMAKKLIAVGIAYFGARGIFKMAKSFLDVASSVETYRLRLEAMLGSQKAATEAMNYFKEVAAKVPFTLEEVIEAGVKVQAFGADLKAWTPIMADLAAFMGVTLPEAASALGRAFAGGAGAADIFRERGILQVIKDFAKMEHSIDDITKLSLPKFREVMFEAFAGAESKVAGTADKLATTWVGIISMLQDKWFKFKDAVMKAKIFEGLKEGLASFNEKLDKFVETGGLDKWAKDTAVAVIDAFRIIVKGIEGLMFSFYTLKAAIYGAITDLTVQMRAYIEKLIIGFGLLEKLGVPVKGILSDLVTEWANLVAEESKLNETIEETTDKMAGILTSFDKLKEKLNAAKEAIEKTKESMKGLGKETEKAGEKAKTWRDDLIGVLEQVQPKFESFAFGYEEAMEKMITGQERFTALAVDEFLMMEGTIKGFVDSILNMFEKWAIGQIIPKVLAAIPFPFNLIAVGGAIASIKAIFAGIKGMKEGGVVMQEGIYHLHPKEMVLPIEKAPQIMREMGQATPGGAGINITYAPQVSAMDSQDVYRFMAGPGRDAFEKMIRSNVRGIAQRIKEETEKF